MEAKRPPLFRHALLFSGKLIIFIKLPQNVSQFALQTIEIYDKALHWVLMQIKVKILGKRVKTLR